MVKVKKTSISSGDVQINFQIYYENLWLNQMNLIFDDRKMFALSFDIKFNLIDKEKSSI